jgi:hypothetical protein
MKTLKEIANTYAETHYPNGCVSNAYSGARNGFMAGVNFAQKWNSVNDKLPNETGWNKAPYLVKTEIGLSVAGYTNGWFHYKGGLCLKNSSVTHWRYIELEH